MQIVRDSYEKTTYRYVLDVNADYIKEINDYAKKYLVEPEKWVDLVEQDFIDVMKDTLSTDKLVAVYEMRYPNVREEPRTYTIQVGEWLEGIINDDIWDSESEIIEGEGYDCDTWIED